MIKSMIREIKKVFRLGIGDGKREGRRRRRVSDTPGPIRVDRETTVASGDYLVAARTRQGLQAQVGGSGGGGSMEVTTVIDVRDGPMRLGMAVATRREMARAGVGRNTTPAAGVRTNGTSRPRPRSRRLHHVPDPLLSVATMAAIGATGADSTYTERGPIPGVLEYQRGSIGRTSTTAGDLGNLGNPPAVPPGSAGWGLRVDHGDPCGDAW